MGTRETDQPPLWIAASDLPASPGHPFYTRLNAILDAHGFDRFAEDECREFYAQVMGRPGLPPGQYFRLLLVGYFEGIDAERGIGVLGMSTEQRGETCSRSSPLGGYCQVEIVAGRVGV